MNTTTEHTPGPWAVNCTHPRRSRVRYAYVVEAAYATNPYGFKTPICPGNGGSEAQANARLIAAAPEMLEALKNLIDCYSDCFGKPDLDRAKDIISKAEGTM
jgi:hypothetical protein